MNLVGIDLGVYAGLTNSNLRFLKTFVKTIVNKT